MTATTMPPPPRPPKRFGWVKWVLLGLVLVLGLPAGCTYAIFGALGDGEAAKIAVMEADRHPLVQQKLGTPLKRGWLTTGSIKPDGTGGRADLAVPVSGPKGSGTAYIRATKSAGRWTVDTLTVTPSDGSSQIHVIGAGIRS